MPELTVLLPNFNNENYLGEAISSILNQTFKDFELLIVDDCSSDNSINVIESFNDNRIRLLKKSKNSGIVDTLNLGLENFDSKYLVRMDGDDVSVPNRFEILINAFNKLADAMVISSSLKLFDKKDELIEVETDPEIIKAGLIYGVTTPHAPSMFNANVFLKNNFRYRSTHPHMEDYDLFYRIKSLGNFYNIKEVLYHYRITGNNVTLKNMDTYVKRYTNFYENVLSDFGFTNSEHSAQCHYNLFKEIRFEISVNDIVGHSKKLIVANNEKGIFNQFAFNYVIKQALYKYGFKAIDKRSSNIWQLLKHGIGSAKHMYYFIKK